jgi:ADP-ribose pyrophosphatase YjhB (NUDIX family)
LRELTKKEQETLIRLITQVKDPIPTPVYNALAARFPHIAIEVAVVRSRAGKWEILLTQRSPEDKFWPNLWHIPGTIIRNRESFLSALQRLEREFGFSFIKEKLEFITVVNYLSSPRGHEISLVYRYIVPPEFQPPKGKFFGLGDLPEEIVREHRLVISLCSCAPEAFSPIDFLL